MFSKEYKNISCLFCEVLKYSKKYKNIFMFSVAAVIIDLIVYIVWQHNSVTDPLKRFIVHLFCFCLLVSVEALFGDEGHTEYEEIDDIDDAFRMQCKQIFIGMVTMQYQAKTNMVRR